MFVRGVSMYAFTYITFICRNAKTLGICITFVEKLKYRKHVHDPSAEYQWCISILMHIILTYKKPYANTTNFSFKHKFCMWFPCDRLQYFALHLNECNLLVFRCCRIPTQINSFGFNMKIMLYFIYSVCKDNFYCAACVYARTFL